MEEVYSQSFVTGDVRMAERLVAEDFIGFEPNGKTSDKAGVLADVRSEPRPTSLKITALTVRAHGDTATALGTEEDVVPGATARAHRRWLDTWRRTAGGWRLVGSAEITPP
jgi:ketosteroid isomerase-like protein